MVGQGTTLLCCRLAEGAAALRQRALVAICIYTRHTHLEHGAKRRCHAQCLPSVEEDSGATPRARCTPAIPAVRCTCTSSKQGPWKPSSYSQRPQERLSLSGRPPAPRSGAARPAAPRAAAPGCSPGCSPRRWRPAPTAAPAGTPAARQHKLHVALGPWRARWLIRRLSARETPSLDRVDLHALLGAAVLHQEVLTHQQLRVYRGIF